MREAICSYCGRIYLRKTKPTTEFNYCSVSCQLKHEYYLGIRDKDKIAQKAQKAALKKLKKHNWLNDIKNRKRLKEVQNTEEYRLKMSKNRVGKKNPMYGKYGDKAGHYKGGSCKDKFGVSSYGVGWKMIKKKIKERDRYKCQKCGFKEEDCVQNLQVHHIVPYKCTQDNSPENLITLCSKCHTKQEPNFLKVKYIKKKKHKGNVYNFSVEEDESYIANNIVVHNCRTSLITRIKDDS
jgi:intein/homing endonuclease